MTTASYLSRSNERESLKTTKKEPKSLYINFSAFLLCVLYSKSLRTQEQKAAESNLKKKKRESKERASKQGAITKAFSKVNARGWATNDLLKIKKEKALELYCSSIIKKGKQYKTGLQTFFSRTYSHFPYLFSRLRRNDHDLRRAALWWTKRYPRCPLRQRHRRHLRLRNRGSRCGVVVVAKRVGAALPRCP